MLDFLQYDFIQNAILIGIALALSAALLSPFLVLNQQAMIADGLAHVSFAGIILGILLSNEALYIALPFVMLASILIKYLSTTKTINGDAAIGLVSSVSFAIGLILVKKGHGEPFGRLPGTGRQDHLGQSEFHAAERIISSLSFLK